MPLERTEAVEGSAYGAALLAGVAAGRYADVDDAIARCVRVAGRVEPDPAWEEAYAPAYDRFRRAFPVVRPLA